MGHGEHGWKLFCIAGTPARKQSDRYDFKVIEKKRRDELKKLLFSLRSHPSVEVRLSKH